MSALERIREASETVEAAQDAICAELDEKPNGQKAKVQQQHAVSLLLDEIITKNTELKGLYEDQDGLLKEELAVVGGPNIFDSFYEALNATREYHTKFPDAPSSSSSSSLSVLSGPPTIPFSGEEVFGKYLDLHSFFVEHCNLPNMPSASNQDYLQYLDKFNSFFHISESCKSTRAYKNYVGGLQKYLSGFLKRIQPLIDIEKSEVPEWRRDFEKRWSEGSVSGWKRKEAPASSSSSSSAALRLGMFNTVQELEALGGERLKEALEALGLKCGGTTQERAARLWSVRGVKEEDIPSKLRAKTSAPMPQSSGSAGSGSTSSSSSSAAADWRKDVAWSEFQVAALSDFMLDVVTATRRHAEKQQTRTAEEKEAELLEEEYGTLPDMDRQAGADEDDEEPIYNPKNIPLGWDGKPIPYWLYKLHGLGVEFKCEICGDQSYWGRLNFDRHFQQSRHALGMRAIGIPNSKHFHDITKIADAVHLFDKIKDTLNQRQFLGDVQEEFEDSAGNILSKRTYEDFSRQGLL